MVRNDSTIAGLTTSTGMLVTAIIGVAFGYGFYGGAVLATVLCVVNAVLLAKVERKQSRAQHFYLEVKNIERMQGVLDEIGKLLCGNCRIDAVSSKSGVSGSVGLEVTARNGKGGEELLQALCAIDGVSYVIKR